MTELYKIENADLHKAKRSRLDFEKHIQDWVFKDPALIGIDALILGKEVQRGDDGKRIDILAMDRDGNLIVVELKRNKTARETVAQALDYASWVRHLGADAIQEIARQYRKANLSELYHARFGEALPDKLNTSHQIIVVASELDAASKRIIEYLSEDYNVGINAVFFEIFEQDGHKWLTTDSLLDQDAVIERAVRRTRGSFTGFYYATGGPEEMRPWEHQRKHGFITAAGGKWYSDRLKQLGVGDQIFYYQVNNGYLGYGIVKSERVPASEYLLSDGHALIEVVNEKFLTQFAGDPDNQAYVVGIDWIKTFDRDNARTFSGIFANQNPVCRIYDQKTADFLVEEFGVAGNEEEAAK